MKLSHFRLQARPFPTTPDPQFYYAASAHEAALERLLRAVEDWEGFVLLTGEAGTGKTLVAHLLLERLGQGMNTALITNCRFASRADLFRAVLFDLGRPYQGMSEQELRLALAEYLLDQFAQGRTTVLVFDEAQGLLPDLLEELRLLGNLEVGRGKAVQVILLALPSLLDTLAWPELAALDQRLAVRVSLEPLDVHESADFLLHQLRQAGGRPERIITDEAVSLLAHNARGLPRLLNRYAYHAMALAEQLAADSVDVEVALEALAALGVEADPVEEEFPTRPMLAAAVDEDETDAPAAPPAGSSPTAPIASRPTAGSLSASGWPSEARLSHPPEQAAQMVFGDGE